MNTHRGELLIVVRGCSRCTQIPLHGQVCRGIVYGVLVSDHGRGYMMVTPLLIEFERVHIVAITCSIHQCGSRVNGVVWTAEHVSSVIDPFACVDTIAYIRVDVHAYVMQLSNHIRYGHRLLSPTNQRSPRMCRPSLVQLSRRTPV